MQSFLKFLIGFVFGSGLVVSGMSDPKNVIDFLDFAAIPTGSWNPGLFFVLASAVAVTFFGYRQAFARGRPIFDTAFHLPTSRQILDPRIVIGPILFGIGWGLVGFCPGPAFTALSTGSEKVAVFCIAMVLSMFASKRIFDVGSSASGLQASGQV
jgi:uncharacterized protein